MKNYRQSRKLKRSHSPIAITLYIVIIFVFSIFIFIIYSRDILDQEQTNFQTTKDQSEQKMFTDVQLWGPPFGKGLHPCVKPTAKYIAAQVSDHYMTVKTNGGLNQMRTGIADMVAVARILNATLIIPQLDKRSFWKDTSTFSDIFDEIHFIESLKEDVRILQELPKELESVPRGRKHFSSWASMSYYEEITHMWNEYQVIHVAKSDSRLANNGLPLDIQRLRCRALYQSLRFSPPIENLGKMTMTPQKLVDRLRSRAKKYLALHLRYEKDMLSFTGCTHGLDDSEAEELKVMRKNTNHWKVKDINSTDQRINGLCPLTPKEVGQFVKALGYPPSMLIYIAAGEIYGGNTRLRDLTSQFPNVVVKEMLVTKEEMKSFYGHASQSAALDYIVSIESDVFLPSHSGHMAIAIEGHRRFLGHRKTITPDRKGLVEIFDNLEAGKLEEPSVSQLVRQLHKNRQGAPRKRGEAPSGTRGRARLRLEESFYQNPYPECICGSNIEKS